MPTSTTPVSDQEQDCYFTAKAVSIRASLASSTNIVSTSASLLSPTSPCRGSIMVLSSQFPPPPGHSHPSFVFRKPTPSLLAGVRESMSSSRCATPTPTDGRESILSATPSQFPQPPSANGKDAFIRPLFAGRESTSWSPPSPPLAGPTPPPKEYHSKLSPASTDYFSSFASFAPFSTSLTMPRGATPGIKRASKPLPIPIVTTPLERSEEACSPAPLLPARQRQSPISPHSPAADPCLTPLTVQTLSHLSRTGLRSPSLKFVEPHSPSFSSRPGCASPLTSAQRDRLWGMKQVYDERRERYERRESDGVDEKWFWGRSRSEDEGACKGTRVYLWLWVAVSLLAMAGVVGLIIALTVVHGGAR